MSRPASEIRAERCARRVGSKPWRCSVSSEPAGADHIVLKHSGEDRLRWGVVSGNAFRYLLHREQQIVAECDERIGVIEDAVERFGCHSRAGTYGDDHDRPEGTLHLDFAGEGAVPYWQGNANRNGKSQCGCVVSRRAYNEKDHIQASDYPEEMSNGITAEQHHTEQGVEARGDESEDDELPPAPSSGEIFASQEN